MKKPRRFKLDSVCVVVGVLFLLGLPGVLLTLLTDFVNFDRVRGMSLSLRLLFVVPSWIVAVPSGLFLLFRALDFSAVTAESMARRFFGAFPALTSALQRSGLRIGRVLRSVFFPKWVYRHRNVAKAVCFLCLGTSMCGLAAFVTFCVWACGEGADEKITTAWQLWPLWGTLPSLLFGCIGMAIGEELGWERVLQEIVTIFGALAVGIGFVSFAIWGDTSYYARAGMPGGGVEGERESAWAFVIVGGVLTLIGILRVVVLVCDCVEKARVRRHDSRK